MQLFLVEACSI